MERILNDRPLTSLTDDVRDFNVLTPNSILLVNLEPSLPPDRFLRTDEYRQAWRFVQLMLDRFWIRWSREYLPQLQKRQKWLYPQRNFSVGDLVLLHGFDTPRGHWPKARVIEVYPDNDGNVRTVKVRTASSEYVRDIRKLSLLEAHSDA